MYTSIILSKGHPSHLRCVLLIGAWISAGDVPAVHTAAFHGKALMASISIFKRGMVTSYQSSLWADIMRKASTITFRWRFRFIMRCATVSMSADLLRSCVKSCKGKIQSFEASAAQSLHSKGALFSGRLCLIFVRIGNWFIPQASNSLTCCSELQTRSRW